MSAVDLSTYGGALLEAGYAGMIVDINEASLVSRTNESATAIDFGGVVARGSADNGCKPVSAASDSILGFAVRHPVMASSAVPGATPVISYERYKSLPVLEIGRIWVTAGANVTAGKKVMVKLSDGSLADETVVPGTASSAAKSGGNTGGGTLTMDATTPVLAGAKAGVYTVRCIATNTNGGQFIVVAPDGISLGQAIVGTTFSNQVKFALADLGTDFAVGDGFDITVTATHIEVPGATWDTTTSSAALGRVRIVRVPK